MKPVSLKQLQSILGGRLFGEDKVIDRVSTDSRGAIQGALFVALKGARFDAHDFVETAKEQGAAALLVSKVLDIDLPQLLVENTTEALGALGAWLKNQCDLKTIAITGSCGKTTVKEMLASILSLQAPTLYTHGNFNNEIGVPLTLLRLAPSDKFAVIELGANHEGEIAYTTQLVKPDIAIVTNLTSAHLEGFGSLAGVAKAKGEIFQGLNERGLGIVNLDSWDEIHWPALLKNKRVQTVSLKNKEADFYAQNTVQKEDGSCRFELVSPKGILSISLNLPGLHHVTNALLATAAALELDGISQEDVIAGLACVSSVKGRGTISFPRLGFRLIDDTYNASLAAMKAAVDLLDSFSGEKVIVLADMGEMGQHAHAVHQELAEYLFNSSIQKVMTYGVESALISAYCHGEHFKTKDTLIENVVKKMKMTPEISVLIKGANGMKMSDVVTELEEAARC